MPASPRLLRRPNLESASHKIPDHGQFLLSRDRVRFIEFAPLDVQSSLLEEFHLSLHGIKGDQWIGRSVGDQELLLPRYPR